MRATLVALAAAALCSAAAVPPPLLLLRRPWHGGPAAATAAAVPEATNRYGIGVYNDTAAPALNLQLPEAAALAGDGGYVLLFFNLDFATDGDPASCEHDCRPLQWQLDAVRQAYRLKLRPIVRLGQWSRRIRNFADGGTSGSRTNYTRLAQQYRRFMSAIPRPPDGTPLLVQLLNEPNVCGEWQCLDTAAGAHLPAATAAAEVAGCLRDLIAALRPLPRLALSVAPLAQVGFARCECTAPFKPIVPQNATALSFAAAMLASVPELYDDVDFLCVHAYPVHGASFYSAGGRAGIVSYQPVRDYINAHRRSRAAAATWHPPSSHAAAAAAAPLLLPVIVGETGWHGDATNQTVKAESIVGALTEVFFADPQIVAVLPYLLAEWGTLGAEKAWTDWPVNATAPGGRYPEWYATKALRCKQGVGGTAGCGAAAASIYSRAAARGDSG